MSTEAAETVEQRIEFLSAILIYSPDAERLARFYRDVLGVPLEEEQHGNGPLHYGCELGDVHFAIHPANGKLPPQKEQPRIKVAFTIFSIEALLEQLARHGIAPLYPRRDTDFAVFAAVLDPDGNYVEFTELSDGWFEHLERRKMQGIDVVARWKARRAK